MRKKKKAPTVPEDLHEVIRQQVVEARKSFASAKSKRNVASENMLNALHQRELWNEFAESAGIDMSEYDENGGTTTPPPFITFNPSLTTVTTGPNIVLPSWHHQANGNAK